VTRLQISLNLKVIPKHTMTCVHSFSAVSEQFEREENNKDEIVQR